MELFLKIADLSWRNLFRNKRRSILTITFLMCGSAGLILVGGYFRHVIKTSKEVLIYSNSGHFQVGREGFYKKGKTAPFEFLIPDYQEAQRRLYQFPEVKLIVPKIYFGGTVSYGETNLPTIIIGVDSDAEKRVLAAYQPRGGEQPSVLLEGKELDPKDPYGILLEEELRDNLGIRVNEPLTLLTFKNGGAIEGGNYRVRGVYRSTSREVRANTMKMPLASAQELFGIPDRVHAFSVILWDEPMMASFSGRFQRMSATVPLEALPWENFSQMIRQGDLFLKNLQFNLQLILVFVFLISISNTINMALLERMREYGTMMALGNGRGVIITSILMEGFFLGLLGALGGVLLSLLTAKIIGSFDIVMPNIPGAAEGAVLFVRFLLEPWMVAKVFMITLFSTVLASMVPAYRISHWPVVRALGYV